MSRQNNSGTYAYFQEAVLGKERDYKLGSRDMHGSKDVVDLVEHTPCAIGYSGLAYATPDVKLVPIRKEEGAARRRALGRDGARRAATRSRGRCSCTRAGSPRAR